MHRLWRKDPRVKGGEPWERTVSMCSGLRKGRKNLELAEIPLDQPFAEEHRHDGADPKENTERDLRL